MVRKKAIYNVNKRLILLIITVLCVGSAFGAYAAIHMNDGNFQALAHYLAPDINQVLLPNSQASFSQTMLKYGKYIFFIWIFGFTSAGMVFILCVLLIKGLSYGFTVAFLLRHLGGNGILFTMYAVLPQNLLLVPATVVLAYYSMQLVLSHFRRLPPKGNLKREKDKIKLEYLLLLMGSILVTAAACMIEQYIVPFLVNTLHLITL